MATVSLRDDIIGGRRRDSDEEAAGSGVPAWLRDDPDTSLPDTATITGPPITDVELAQGWRLLTIRDRDLTGYDPDGNPEWTWAVKALDVAAFVGETRTEVDDRAGLTHVVADAKIPYLLAEGIVRETAVATDDLGGRWLVTRAHRYPDRLEMRLERIDDAG